MSGVVFVNGREATGAPALRADDRGFTLGDGLFETVRLYGGRPFQLAAHLARLASGAERIRLPLPPDLMKQIDMALAAYRARVAASVTSAPIEASGAAMRRPGPSPDRPPLSTLAKQGAAGRVPAFVPGDASLRITVSRGPGAGGAGLAPPDSPRVTTVIAIAPYTPNPSWYRRGLRVVTAPGRLNEFSPTAGLKRVGYLDAIVALQHARARSAEEALFLDTRGHVAEATASNIFLVLDGNTLITPPPACGILPGITRAAILDLARGAGIMVREEPVAPELLSRAGEIFLTSSLREVVPVTTLDGHPVGGGRLGPVTARLHLRYRELVRRTTTPAEGPVQRLAASG